MRYLQKSNAEYSLFNTSWGWVGVIISERGIRRIILPQSNSDIIYEIIRNESPLATFTSHASDITQKITAYLSGQKVKFNNTLDYPNITQFQNDVYQTTCSIPYGETRSYSWVAKEIGNIRATRAVGQALAHNPTPIIVPCHRVISLSGNLQGFRGGIDMKKRLILMEKSVARRKLQPDC